MKEKKVFMNMLRDHSVWSSHVHKMPLQMRACSLLPHNYSVSPSSFVHWHCAHSCVSLLELPAMINLYKDYYTLSVVIKVVLLPHQRERQSPFPSKPNREVQRRGNPRRRKKLTIKSGSVIWMSVVQLSLLWPHFDSWRNRRRSTTLPYTYSSRCTTMHQYIVTTCWFANLSE